MPGVHKVTSADAKNQLTGWLRQVLHLELVRTHIMIILLFIYLSAAYWIFRRHPRHIGVHAVKLIPLIILMIPLLLFLMLIQTPLTQIGSKVSSLFGIKEEDIFCMALSVLLFLFSAILIHFSFDCFHMAYRYLGVKLVCTLLFFVTLAELFFKKSKFERGPLKK